jgi:hypothetical protein
MWHTAITFIFHKVLGISFLTEEILAFQKGLCYMKSVRVFRDISYPILSSCVTNHSAMYCHDQSIFSNCTGICMIFRLMYLLHVTLSSLMPLAVISSINGAITHNHPVCCLIAQTACWYSDTVLPSFTLFYARYFFVLLSTLNVWCFVYCSNTTHFPLP